MSSTPDINPALRSYFDGINDERYDDVASLFADDGELRAPGTEPRRGKAELVDYYRAALRPYPEHRDEPTRFIIAGRTATVEIHFSGTLASGVRMEFDALDIFDFDEHGRIVRLSSWYDSHDVRAKLQAARGDAAGAATASATARGETPLSAGS